MGVSCVFTKQLLLNVDFDYNSYNSSQKVDYNLKLKLLEW